MFAAPRLPAVAVAALLLAVALSAATGWGVVPWWPPLLLAAGVALSEIAVVHLQFGRQRWTLSLTEGALGAAWVLATGAWTVAAVVVGVLFAQLVRRQPAWKLGFNTAQLALSAAAGALVAQQLGGDVLGAVAGLLVFWVLNLTLVAVAVSLTSERGLPSLLRGSALLSAAHAAGNASLGLLAAVLVQNRPLALLGLVFPLGWLWASYDQQAQRAAETALYAELARGQARASGRSTEESAQTVVQAAARLLGGAEVDLVLMAADGPVHYRGTEAGEPSRQRVDPSAFDARWVLGQLGTKGVDRGTDQGRPWCAAVLGEPDAPYAVLRARREVGAPAFDRRELRLVQVLVSQAESWLAVSDLSLRSELAVEYAAKAGASATALGDLGAATTPALTILRESAERLAQMAASAGGVEDIVEELQVVERAVASLLGAIALAAEPDLSRVGSTSRVAQLRPDWTTTGVLP